MAVSDLESTLTGFFVSVDYKGVNGSENPETLRASAEGTAPEWGGQMDLSADQLLAEVFAGRQIVWRPRAAGALVFVDQTAVRR